MKRVFEFKTPVALVAAAALMGAGSGVALGAGAPPLVTPQWVAQNSCKPGVTVIDVRSRVGGGGNYYTYLAGHVPCAVYSNYVTAGWRVKRDGVVGMMAPVASLEKLIGGLGVGNDTHVVIYAAGTNALDAGSATRVFWTFKMLGDNDVSIMNGGYAAYVRAKLPVRRGKYTRGTQTFVAHLDPAYLATEAQVEKALKTKDAVLIDNRPTDQYLGVVKPGVDKRAGAIPGAHSLPQGWLTVNDGGTFRTPAQYRALYRYAGVPVKGQQITYCNTGHWASLGWFVSTQILKNKDVRLYDGSMAQWSRNPKLPMVAKVQLP